MPITFTASDAPSHDLARAVGQGLDGFNLAAAPSLVDVRPLAVAAADAHGSLIGGAIGRTWGQCCELLELWVAADARGRGVGAGLVTRFETHARQRGCSVFYLTTLSFQAPGFYSKLGYVSVARIAGYPDGIVKHLMLKSEA